MLLVYPLYVGSEGYANITAAKYSFFIWSTVGYLSLLLFFTVELLIVRQIRFKEILAKLKAVRITQICILVYLFFCCVSALLSDYGSAVWHGLGRNEGLETTLLYIGVFFAVSIFGKFHLRYLYLIGIVIILNTLLGCLQFAGQNPLGLFPAGYTYHDAFILYSNAFMGTLGNLDLLSAFLCLTIPVFYGYFILCDKLSSVILMIPFACGVFLLLLIGVSAGIVGLGAAILLTVPAFYNSKRRVVKGLLAFGLMCLTAGIYTCIVFTYKDHLTELHFRPDIHFIILIAVAIFLIYAAAFLQKNRSIKFGAPQKMTRLLFFGVAGIVLLIPVAVWFAPVSSGSIYEAQRILHGNADPSFGSGRIRIWTAVLSLVPEHLFFGGGPDTLVARMPFSFEGYSAELGIKLKSVIDVAHNDYLNILVNTGLFSLLAYCSALTSAAVQSVRVYTTQPIILITGTALLSYLAQIFFSFSLCIISPFFWIAFGMLVNMFPGQNKERNLSI